MATRRAAYSEGDAWRSVALAAKVILEETRYQALSTIRGEAEHIALLADAMLAQLAEGTHENPRRKRNPSLVVFGNPPLRKQHGLPGFTTDPEEPLQAGEGITLSVTLRKLLGYVEQLNYERVARPVGFYFHDFGIRDGMWAAELYDKQRVVLLANANGRPLWDKR